MKSGSRGVFFTLEYTEKDMLDRFRAIGVAREDFAGLFEFDSSDEMSSDYIVKRLARRLAAPWWSWTICNCSTRSVRIRN
jgi:hypothetical protein